MEGSAAARAKLSSEGRWSEGRWSAGRRPQRRAIERWAPGRAHPEQLLRDVGGEGRRWRPALDLKGVACLKPGVFEGLLGARPIVGRVKQERAARARRVPLSGAVGDGGADGVAMGLGTALGGLRHGVRAGSREESLGRLRDRLPRGPAGRPRVRGADPAHEEEGWERRSGRRGGRFWREAGGAVGDGATGERR